MLQPGLSWASEGPSGTQNAPDSGTTTLAPPGGVDCNGDGVPDLAEGQPLVCRISSTGSGIAQAVVNSVLALAKK
jgi:hypothetical protein